jgi:hypothetical protein
MNDATQTAAAAKSAATNMLELAGFGPVCGLARVRCWVNTYTGPAGKYQSIGLAIMGHKRGDKLRNTREDKAVRAALAAAAAEVDAPLYLEVD